MKRSAVLSLAGCVGLSLAAVSQESQPPIPLQFQVLTEKVIHDGQRTITMRRVEPPQITTRAEAGSTSTSSTESQAVDFEEQEQDDRPYQVLSLSCTVFNAWVTDLRWSVAGRNYRAWCNVDFFDLTSISSLETTDAVYSVFLGLGAQQSDDSEPTASSDLALPAPSEFPAGYSSYRIISHPDGVSETQMNLDCAGVEALLAHYDEHKAELQEARSQREAKARERAEWLKANPPQPKDIIINYWPIRSSTQTQEGEAQ